MEIYEVGGCIRDELMGITPKDRDYVVVGSTPEEMIELGYKQVGESFPVFLSETGDEYALARTEISIGPSHTDFKVDFSSEVTLEQDLKRRDLTINAIAKSEDGVIHDPYNGIKHIESKIFRVTSSQSFEEDPLRVLRLARFAARFGPEWTIDPSTKLIAARMDLSTLNGDRIQKELIRALMEPYPVLFFKTLVELNALHKVFPELNNLRFSPEKLEYHGERDTFAHTMLVLKVTRALDGCTEDRMIAALLHDFGKMRSHEAPRFVGHENEIQMVDDFCEKYRCTASARSLARMFMKYHMRLHNLRKMKPVKIVRLIKAISRNIDDIIMLGIADHMGRIAKDTQEIGHLERLKDQHDVVMSIRLTESEMQGLSGEAIGMKLEQKRVKALKEFNNMSKEERRTFLTTANSNETTKES